MSPHYSFYNEAITVAPESEAARIAEKKMLILKMASEHRINYLSKLTFLCLCYFFLSSCKYKNP